MRRQRGDTLIEVTVALAILSVVLISSFFLAVRAYQTTLDARERSQAVDLLQQQAEALHFIRDDATNWFTGFYNPISAAVNMSGHITANGNPPAFNESPDSFYLRPNGSGGWIVVQGPCNPGSGTLPANAPCANQPFTLQINVADNTASKSKIIFHLKATWESRISPGVTNSTDIYTDLINLDVYKNLGGL